jgi:putative endonuclease
MNKTFCVYITANRRNGALYIGVTSDLPRRIRQHKQKEVDGFTARYGVDKLVYYEACESAESAIQREKQLKKWAAVGSCGSSRRRTLIGGIYTKRLSEVRIYM